MARNTQEQIENVKQGLNATSAGQADVEALAEKLAKQAAQFSKPRGSTPRAQSGSSKAWAGFKKGLGAVGMFLSWPFRKIAQGVRSLMAKGGRVGEGAVARRDSYEVSDQQQAVQSTSISMNSPSTPLAAGLGQAKDRLQKNVDTLKVMGKKSDQLASTAGNYSANVKKILMIKAKMDASKGWNPFAKGLSAEQAEQALVEEGKLPLHKPDTSASSPETATNVGGSGADQKANGGDDQRQGRVAGFKAGFNKLIGRTADTPKQDSSAARPGESR